MTRYSRHILAAGLGGLGLWAATTAAADQQILDDLIVTQSLCVGQDCVNGESFGFDTIRLKENNVRIKFDDTSNSASFPNRDWQLTANDSTNGGANKFSIDDITGGRTPFTIEAGAPNNSLYVDDGGRVGLGTATPVVELHIPDGDTPTLRLEQDGTSGFTPQIWDVAGNEAGFFVRDVTNGSQLAFRIRPGADASSIDIQANNNVGINTASAQAALHVRRADGTTQLRIEEASGTQTARDMVRIINNGRPEIVLANTQQAREWAIGGGTNLIFKAGAQNSTTDIKTKYMEINGNNGAVDFFGNITTTGSLTTGGTGTCSGGCDAVFNERRIIPAEDYRTAMWDQGYLPHVGPTPEGAPINVAVKLTGMLNALEHAHIFIEEQADEIATLKADHAARIEALMARIDALEAR